MITTSNFNLSEQATQSHTNSSLNCNDSRLDLKLLSDENEKNPTKMAVKFCEAKLKNWKVSSLKDEFRPEFANNSSGGIDYNNKELVSMMRSTGYDIIKQIGKKIITGDFNLTTISFPIKVMLPMSILQAIAKSVFQFPIYLNMAANTRDPLEKFKLVVTATIAGFHQNSQLLKPLNPILGETYESVYEDGSRIFLEQTSHHPPVSHYYMIGPDFSYKFSGFSLFKSSAGLNSLKLYNKGKRLIEFPDGTKIHSTFCNELYSNTFFGTVRHESLGDIILKDITNGFEVVLKLGGVKKKPSDYFMGEIKHKGITVSKVLGSYLSFIEFNGLRYWDIRENIPIKMFEAEKHLKSSSLFREDRRLLQEGKIEAAQAAKEKLEEIQRADRKLREVQEKKDKKEKKGKK